MYKCRNFATAINSFIRLNVYTVCDRDIVDYQDPSKDNLKKCTTLNKNACDQILKKLKVTDWKEFESKFEFCSEASDLKSDGYGLNASQEILDLESRNIEKMRSLGSIPKKAVVKSSYTKNAVTGPIFNLWWLDEAQVYCKSFVATPNDTKTYKFEQAGDPKKTKDLNFLDRTTQ